MTQPTETGNPNDPAAPVHGVSRQTVRRLLWLNGWAAAIILCFGLAYWQHQRHEINRMIVQAASEHQLDPLLVSAVVWKESRYQVDAIGGVGEIGLMQVRPSTAGDWAKAVDQPGFDAEHLFDPRVNLNAGCWYLARGYNKWKDKKDPWPWVLAQYNAGPSRVAGWESSALDDPDAFVAAIPIDSTRQYVQDILARWRSQ